MSPRRWITCVVSPLSLAWIASMSFSRSIISGPRAMVEILADRDDDRRLRVERLDLLGLWKIDLHAGGQHRRGYHEDDEQHQHRIDERRHVDLGEWSMKAVSGFGGHHGHGDAPRLRRFF